MQNLRNMHCMLTTAYDELSFYRSITSIYAAHGDIVAAVLEGSLISSHWYSKLNEFLCKTPLRQLNVVPIISAYFHWFWVWTCEYKGFTFHIRSCFCLPWEYSTPFCCIFPRTVTQIPYWHVTGRLSRHSSIAILKFTTNYPAGWHLKQSWLFTSTLIARTFFEDYQPSNEHRKLSTLIFK